MKSYFFATIALDLGAEPWERGRSIFFPDPAPVTAGLAGGRLGAACYCAYQVSLFVSPWS
jgi:hypothetical protein